MEVREEREEKAGNKQLLLMRAYSTTSLTTLDSERLRPRLGITQHSIMYISEHNMKDINIFSWAAARKKKNAVFNEVLCPLFICATYS